MKMFKKIAGLFKKKVSTIELNNNGKLIVKRTQVNEMFGQFIQMEEDLRGIVEEIKVIREEAIAEIAELQKTVSTADEDIAVNEAMAENLLQFINPVAGGKKATVSVDSTEMKLEDIE